MNPKYQAKLFAGFLLKPDLREKLNKSPLWKNSRIAITDNDLIEVQEKNHHYVGIYIKEDAVSFKSLQQTEKKLKEMLQNYLKDTPTHDLQLEILSKLFFF